MRQGQPSAQLFIRDRLTWLAYIMLAYIGFSQSILGPLMPFLRNELHLNYTLGGFLPATLAVGLIISGMTGDQLARHWGRRIVFWNGAIVLALSAILLGLSRSFELTLIAVLGMGVGSSITQVMIQALLADQHGELRSIAFTESNVAASLSATFTPLVIGGLQNTGVGWRVVPVLVLFFLMILIASFRGQAVPNSTVEELQPTESNNRLSFSFWLYWIVLFLVVAAEMSMVVWATDFLANVAGLRPANAALAFGAFPAAMLLGRFAGTRFTRRWSSVGLLLASLGITMIGFLMFWLTRIPALNVSGLFVAGLGIANLYPLTLSIAVGLAAGQSNTASARVSFGVGTALLTAPLFLGWLADRLSLQNAYSIVIIFVIAASAIIVNKHWLLGKRSGFSLVR
jgi:MFS family permease